MINVETTLSGAEWRASEFVNCGHGVIETFQTCSVAAVLCSAEWLRSEWLVSDSIYLTMCKWVHIRGGSWIFFLLWSLNERCMGESSAASRAVWMLQQRSIPNNLIENSLLAGFHRTNVSLTFCQPFFFSLNWFILLSPGAWSMTGNVFLRTEEFTYESLTCFAASFPLLPLCFVVNHSFSSKRETVSMKNPANKQPRGE